MSPPKRGANVRIGPLASCRSRQRAGHRIEWPLPDRRHFMATPAAADDVLFFIPDIGGFTKFIAETEIQHSQHIIQELLELLVDANTLGMTVGEFEGDAVLFYRNGPPPSLEQMVQQARKMYLDFHS